MDYRQSQFYYSSTSEQFLEILACLSFPWMGKLKILDLLHKPKSPDKRPKADNLFCGLTYFARRFYTSSLEEW